VVLCSAIPSIPSATDPRTHFRSLSSPQLLFDCFASVFLAVLLVSYLEPFIGSVLLQALALHLDRKAFSLERIHATDEALGSYLGSGFV
jgi:hypothetical protein